MVIEDTGGVVKEESGYESSERRRKTINLPSHVGKFSGFIPFVVGGGGERIGVYIEKKRKEEGKEGSVYIKQKERKR